jgi:SNF2 family DNA or RNA helicase
MSFEFKTKPFDYQKNILIQSYHKKEYALFLEMGLGKTKIILDHVAALMYQGKISRVLIIAPAGVHYQWINESKEEHWAGEINNIKCDFWSWQGGKTKKELRMLDRLLKVDNSMLSINFEAILLDRTQKYLTKFLKSGLSYIIVDESSKIKNIKAQRTREILKLSDKAVYKRILSGTPIIQNPLDLFTQFKFLDPSLLGHKTFGSFRARYAIIQEVSINNHTVPLIKGFKNTAILKNKIAPHSIFLKKEDCLDLPDKIFLKKSVLLSKKELSVYQKAKNELLIQIEQEEVSIQNQLVLLLKLQQIAGGFFSGESGTSPVLIDKIPSKAARLLEILEEIPQTSKVVIWCRFVHECTYVYNLLIKETPHESIIHTGSCTPSDNERNIQLFREDENIRYFIATQASCGIGRNLQVADYCVYYSNDFSLEHRLQSVARTHRIGSKSVVTYIDLVARDSIDERILEALDKKKGFLDYFKNKQGFKL